MTKSVDSVAFKAALNKALQEIIALIGGERGLILLFDADGNLTPASLQSLSAIAEAFIPNLADDEIVIRSLAQQVRKTGEGVVTTNVQEDSRFSGPDGITSYKLRSILAYPVQVDDQVVGMIYLDNRIKAGLYGNSALDKVRAIIERVEAELGSDENTPTPSTGFTESESEKTKSESKKSAEELISPTSAPGSGGGGARPVPSPPSMQPSTPAEATKRQVPRDEETDARPSSKKERSTSPLDKVRELLDPVFKAIKHEFPKAEPAKPSAAKESASDVLPDWLNPKEAETESSPEGGPGSMPSDERQDQFGSTSTPPVKPKPAIRTDDVFFTAYHPKEATVETWYTLLVYAYIEAAAESMRKDAARFQEEMSSTPKEMSAANSTQLERGTEITIVPSCEGLTFNPERVTFKWVEDRHRADFRFRADKSLSGDAAKGSITIYVGPLIVATIKLAMLFEEEIAAPPRIMVHTQSQVKPQTETSTKLYKQESIFASYSHADTDVVTECRKAYRALGYDVLIDIDNLRSGQHWNDEIKNLIARADIFQLFWSQRAAQSAYVQQEWEYALQHRKEDGFIRPVYWEQPMPTPPQELSDIHFAYVPLKAAP